MKNPAIKKINEALDLLEIQVLNANFNNKMDLMRSSFYRELKALAEKYSIIEYEPDCDGPIKRINLDVF